MPIELPSTSSIMNLIVLIMIKVLNNHIVDDTPLTFNDNKRMCWSNFQDKYWSGYESTERMNGMLVMDKFTGIRLLMRIAIRKICVLEIRRSESS